jgi:formate transporter
MEKFNGHTAREIGILCTHAGIAKAELKWLEMAIKSLLGGNFQLRTIFSFESPILISP